MMLSLIADLKAAVAVWAVAAIITGILAFIQSLQK